MNAIVLSPPKSQAAAAILDFSGLRLELPQTEIHALENAVAMDTEETKPFSVGWVHVKEERWPVYCLGPDLNLLIVVPRERRSCVVLNTGAGYVGILCDAVTLDVEVRPEQRNNLPAAMRLPDTPVLGLVLLDEDAVASSTNAEHLVEHITRLVNL